MANGLEEREMKKRRLAQRSSPTRNRWREETGQRCGDAPVWQVGIVLPCGEGGGFLESEQMKGGTIGRTGQRRAR